jgi:hypothetical protein
MKKFIRNIAVALTSLLSFFGFQKAKEPVQVSDRKTKVARQRVLKLDEHEISAFHSN